MNLRQMLEAMVAEGATDVMLSAGNPPCVRILGKVEPFGGGQRLSPELVEKLVDSLLDERQREIFERENELDCSISVPGAGRFRVNIFKQRSSVSMVLRALGTDVPVLEELGLPPAVSTFAELDEGLVCICGPSGSGKSTTVAAIVDRINAGRHCHVITLEQPIEYLHPMKKSLVEQREVGSDTGSYVQALRRVLRQSPDVVVIGELDGLETIAAALKIAETGHLVITTLGTSTVHNTLESLVDGFPAYQTAQVRAQLACTLKAVLCQRLLPGKDGRGLRAACELMMVNEAIARLITEGKFHLVPDAMREAAHLGMKSMDESILELVGAGLVDERIALSKIRDQAAARARLEEIRSAGARRRGDRQATGVSTAAASSAAEGVGQAEREGEGGGGGHGSVPDAPEGARGLLDGDDGTGRRDAMRGVHAAGDAAKTEGAGSGTPPSARELEKRLYSTDPSVRRAAEVLLKKMQKEGNTEADEILRQFERFYGSNFEELKWGVKTPPF